jgi:hypothetical protein
MQAYQAHVQQMQHAQQASQQQGAPVGAMPGQPPMAAPAQPGAGALTQLPPPPQMVAMPNIDPEHMQDLFATATGVPWEDVSTILKSDAKRAFKLDIETDETAQVMVVIRLPSCMAARIMQDTTRRPSICTVQAPHSPRSHPFFVPVRLSCPRSASSSVVRGSSKMVRN